MNEHPWIPCLSESGSLNPVYLDFVVTSAAFTLFFIIGFLITCIYILFKYRLEIQSSDSEKIWWFDFLVTEYSPQFFYWEMIMILRRLLIALIQAIFGNEGLGYTFILLVLVFWGFLLSHVQPFKHRSVLYLELVVTFTLVVTSGISMIFGRYGRSEIYFLFLLVVPFLYLIVNGFYQIYKNPKKLYKFILKFLKVITCDTCRTKDKKK